MNEYRRKRVDGFNKLEGEYTYNDEELGRQHLVEKKIVMRRKPVYKPQQTTIRHFERYRMNTYLRVYHL